MKTLLKILAAALLTNILASGCGAVAQASEPKLLNTSSYPQCPWKFGESGFDVVRDSAGWQQLMAQAKPNAGDIRNWLPNFAEGQRVIIYRLGQKSSAGFGATYGTPAIANANNLRLPVTQIRPEPGTMQATVLTSPCTVGLLQSSHGVSLELIDSTSNTILATGKL